MNKDPNLPSSEEKKDAYQNIFESVVDGLIINDLESGLVVEANPAAWLMHGYTREEFIGQLLTICVHPDSQYVFSDSIQEFELDSIFDVQVLDVRRDGSTFFAVWRGTAFTYQGRPCLLGIIHDVSKRMLIEELLSQRVEIRTHEQATLLEISYILASTLELQPGLILDQLRKIIEYAHGGLFALKDSSLVTLAIRGTHQLEQFDPISIPLPTPETLAILFNRHRPIRVADVWSDDPQAKFLRSLLEDRASVLLEGMQSWMWVPLAVRGRIIGGVGVAHDKRDFFTTHHADLALSVANQAAITMINSELYGQAQALAVLEERQRLARNLHDAVNQSLFSAGLIAEVLPRLWDRDQDEARHSLNDLRKLTRGAMAEMRALLAELRPSTLIDSDLGDLLRQLGSAIEARTNLPVDLTVPKELTLPAVVQVAFYRICQESLNNIAKHAKAGKVVMDVRQDDAVVELRIYDDGQGFDVGQKVSGHYGLGMMHERAEAAGLLLTITSQPAQGTEIKICWTKTPTHKVFDKEAL